MDSQVLQWIGYLASGIIALSMMINSIVKFRWVNLVGAASFATYGFLIGAFPVMLLNGIIVMVDIYYLFRIYTKPNLFDTLEISEDSKYLLKFLDFHNDEIQKFFPGFEYKPEMNTISFFVLRNMAVAGVFLAHRKNEDILEVGLDYVVPEYRDYKNGKFLYYSLKDRFIQAGFKSIEANNNSPKHIKYLKKLGFKQKGTKMVKDLI
ncbi:MAG TPA: hypothetical protein ENK91_00475 [Bacteroidetes bacterium]|nr:hypothetical protein [Bacteroidota bacterium]